MKKIIVPVDFSKQSEYALKTAASLALKHNAGILVVHMLELNNSLNPTPEVVNQEYTVFLIKAAEKRLKEFLDKPYLKGINVTPIIKHYKVFSELNEIAEMHDADLVVMGSHGSDGLKEIFVGSNAEKVVRHSLIPVLVVKNDYKDFKIDRLVFASNFKLKGMKAFEKAKAFAELVSAELDLVYINTPYSDFLSTEDAVTRINKFLAKANLVDQVEIYNDYSVEMGILNYSKANAADAIALWTHGRKGLAHFFSGSIGEDVTNRAKIPVITFRIG
ncbi:Nucleotide-binding universal stress protein, UspA family [Pricia antarctica]|uniref:Nucleotide-binding universal stress protein, UspA family n=2 Tax=Pricia antarctica TaxID=641691 RepID=A0A1G7D9D5_9FLAO|nr:Nucleotide-binding universal stress protein, UspA family [Pricia antarctica]